MRNLFFIFLLSFNLYAKSNPGEQTKLEDSVPFEHNHKQMSTQQPDNFKSVDDNTKIDLGQDKLPSSYTALLGYILPSPDQHTGGINAGSCHYMAITGALEILANMDVAPKDRVSDGLTDFSERASMNLADLYPNSWLVNDAYMYNDYGGAILNKDYRYTKKKYGWWIFGSYSVKGNWDNDLPKNYTKIFRSTPKIEQTLLFGSSDFRTRYDVSVMSDKTIDRIKRALIKYKGPISVVYNDTEVWHNVLIVGYDDNDTMPGSDKRCPFVKSLLPSLTKAHQDAINKRMVKEGCNDKGVFYVRESEAYPGPFFSQETTMYDYDFSRIGEEQPYVAKYIKRSYEWMKYLGSYAIAIYRPDVMKTKFPPSN